MATYTKLPLSSSVNGRRILITATTSGSVTPIHTAPALEVLLQMKCGYTHIMKLQQVYYEVYCGEEQQNRMTLSGQRCYLKMELHCL